MHKKENYMINMDNKD